MLAARATRARRDPRHRVGGDPQPARGPIHAVDGFHRPIVAAAATVWRLSTSGISVTIVNPWEQLLEGIDLPFHPDLVVPELTEVKLALPTPDPSPMSRRRPIARSSSGWPVR